MSDVAIPPVDTPQEHPVDIPTNSQIDIPDTKQTRKERLLNEAGVTRKKLYKTLLTQLEAERVVVDRYGEEIYRGPDNPAIGKALEISFKLFGDLVEDKVGVNVLNLDARMSELILKETRRAIAMQSGVREAAAEGVAVVERDVP